MVGKREEARGVKARMRNSSMSEKPVRSRLRRLVDWINPRGAKKVHSLIDKVYKRKNLEMAWERDSARGCAYSSNAKDNFSFDRMLRFR